MIQGVAILRTSQSRITTRTRTRAASATPSRRPTSGRTASKRESGNSLRASGCSAAKPYLARALGNLAELRVGGVQPYLVGRPRDLAVDGVAHRLASPGLLEGGEVRIGYALEVVLVAHVLAGAGAHALSKGVVGREPLENPRENLDLTLIDRNLRRHPIRQLGEPADVADDERAAESERADRARGGLAHGRGAQAHAHVAAREQGLEPALVDIAEDDDSSLVAPEGSPLELLVEVEVAGNGAREEQRRVRKAPPHAGEGRDQLRHPLRPVQIPEASDQGPAGARPLRSRRRVGAGRERDAPDRLAIAELAHQAGHVAGMDDGAVGEIENLRRERKLMGTGLPERRQQLVDDAVSEQPPFDPRFPLHRVEVALAVAAAEREPRHEMVEHELVQHDHARPAAQGVDDPAVRVRVVPDVVERHVCPPGCSLGRRHGAGSSSALKSAIPERSGGSGEKYATFTARGRKG